jgi:transposase InsO family protein
LEDETAVTAVAFLIRARAWFAAHGITQIERIVTDNGACYRASGFTDAMGESRHQRITPYTPRHNGKIERYNRILAEEFLYARTWTSERERTAAIQMWNRHYNYHRPHGAHDGKPPASATPRRVHNVMPHTSSPRVGNEVRPGARRRTCGSSRLSGQYRAERSQGIGSS